jgi:DNA-binding MarR family transcriptional regulator
LELFFATACLFTVTLAASFIYYKRIKEAQMEYEGSKDVVRNLTLGFSGQVTRLSQRIRGIEEGSNVAQDAASEALKASQQAIDETRRSGEKALKLEGRIEESESAIASMKEEMKRLSIRPSVAVPMKTVDAPIPLRQDAVLDQLTETELDVLTMIEELGEGSVPEIRDRIGKTREHTARLLKKLFDRGFIDRNTSSMPYRYNIRKEIIELIKQQRDRAELSV